MMGVFPDVKFGKVNISGVHGFNSCICHFMFVYEIVQYATNGIASVYTHRKGIIDVLAMGINYCINLGVTDHYMQI